MASKTLSFNFLKKTLLKFSESSSGFKLEKKNIYGSYLIDSIK